MSRRRFLKLLGGATFAAACGTAPTRFAPATATPPSNAPLRAVGFDLFTVFDPRGVDGRVAEVLPDVSGFAETWKSRLFQYSWLRAAAGPYVDFEQLVKDALRYAADVHAIELGAAQAGQLQRAFTELSPWPDSADALRSLRNGGLRLAPLANFSPSMIEALLGHAGMRGHFDAIASTHLARSYKPDPRAYAVGEQVFGLPRDQIAFSAFGGWDAAGARWFGYPTFWVNRLGATPEVLAKPHATGSTLTELARWALDRT